MRVILLPGAFESVLREVEVQAQIHTLLLPGATRKTEHFRTCA